jgi:endonuclease VIII
MPEGHTIHRIAQDHTKHLVGKPVAVSSPQGRFADDAAIVDGTVLNRIEAYGKHLFYWWQSGHVGHVHLGLFGKFRVSTAAASPAPKGEVRMRMVSDSATIDLAGPTACVVATEADRDAIVDRLGPDPLRRDAKPQLAFDRIRKSKQPIGALLLDQKVLCGVGNVYRAEALFVNGIHPGRVGKDCDDVELAALWSTIVGMLKQGVKDNRIITVDRREMALPKGRIRRGEATYVYHRDRCLRCGTAILTSELAGRPCYYCPTCQPS